MKRFCIGVLIFCSFIICCSSEENSDAEGEDVSRIVPGGHVGRDPNDPLYRQMAEESLKKYQQTICSDRVHKVLEVKSVTVQVVAGKLTRINFTAAMTDCQIDGDVQEDLCIVSDLSNVLLCSSEILEQIWLDKTDINVSCSPMLN